MDKNDQAAVRYLPKISVKERLLRGIRKEESGCWVWTKSGTASNQGKMSFYIGRGKHAYRMAHRVSYEVHKGPIPEGMHVLHKCDVPRCCNPDHLFLGTHADNMRDMVSKGRHRPAGHMPKNPTRSGP